MGLRYIEKPPGYRYDYGTRLQKKSGSQWRGKVVGFYETALTAEGYAIESEQEPGSVQIYPLQALEKIPE